MRHASSSVADGRCGLIRALLLLLPPFLRYLVEARQHADVVLPKVEHQSLVHSELGYDLFLSHDHPGHRLDGV